MCGRAQNVTLSCHQGFKCSTAKIKVSVCQAKNSRTLAHQCRQVTGDRDLPGERSHCACCCCLELSATCLSSPVCSWQHVPVYSSQEVVCERGRPPAEPQAPPEGNLLARRLAHCAVRQVLLQVTCSNWNPNPDPGTNHLKLDLSFTVGLLLPQ